MKHLLKGFALGAALLSAQPALAADRELLNTSYDIARELFAAYNVEFKKHWQEKTGETLEVNQSHAGSSKQAQAIIQGLKADVATFNQVTDIDILHERGNLIPESRCSYLQSGNRHRHPARTRQPDPRKLGRAPAQQQLPLLFHHGVPGSQGQSEEHPELG